MPKELTNILSNNLYVFLQTILICKEEYYNDFTFA